MTYVKMVKCIRISVIDIGVKSPKAGIAHPSGVPKFILGFSGVSVAYLLHYFLLNNTGELM
jgi:hypothetical protein